MHTRPIINTVQSALTSQASLAGDDPTSEAAVAQLAEALGPALQLAAIQLAEQAAAEVGAQLPDHSVEVVVVDGDPSLRVSEAPTASTAPTSEEHDARITLRLPPTLKEQIETSAKDDGDSVNTWVIDVLSKRSGRSKSGRRRITESFDL